MGKAVSGDGRRQSRRQLQRKQASVSKQTPDIARQELDEEMLLDSQTLSQQPDQILHLQNTIGNQAVQRLLNPDRLQSPNGNEFLATFGSTHHTPAIQRNDSPESEEDDTLPSEVNSQSASTLQKSPIQRQETPDGTTQPANVVPYSAQGVTPARQGDIQRGPLAKKIGKHVGYGVLTMIAEQVIGPFADLKHLIRAGYYSRVKSNKEKKGQGTTGVESKQDKLSKRVKEEWVGNYGGNTWMAVIHGISTTAEKLAALAGAIGLLAAISSAFAPPAAVVATIAGIIAASLAGLALIGRGILSIASGIKYNKAAAGPDKERWREMYVGNVFKVVSNLLNIATFGVGAGVGGLDFVASGAKTGVEVGTDIAIGASGGLTDTLVGNIGETVVQDKRLQREPEDEESKDEEDAKATLMELDETLGNLDSEMSDEKAAASEDKNKLESAKSGLGKADSKMSDLSEKSNEIKEKSTEAETELNNADSQAETPDEASASVVSKSEIKELESDVERAETAIQEEKDPGQKPDVQKKKGFFKRIKGAAKKAGKKFKRGFKKLFLRLKSVFNRVKALLQKAKAKITRMVISVLGLTEDVAAAQEEIQDQKDNQIPASMESIDNQTETIDAIKEKLGEQD